MTAPLVDLARVEEIRRRLDVRYYINPAGALPINDYERATVAIHDVADLLATVTRLAEDNARLRAALERLYQTYVSDMHGEATCDCDPSVGLDSCAPCDARAALAARPTPPEDGA